MRTAAEVQDVLADVMDAALVGERRFPGMSYEDGVQAALLWMLGESDEHPYPEQ